MCSFSAGMEYGTQVASEMPPGDELHPAGAFSANFALSQSAEVATLRLQGDIDVSIATELKAAVIEVLSMGKEICIQLDDATGLDVTAFQLLWLARREAARMRLKFSISGELSKPARASLEELGIYRKLFEQVEEPTVHAD